MRNHMFMSLLAVNQGNVGTTQFLVFPDAQEAAAHLRDWLERSCGLDCFCGPEEEEALRQKNGGDLPELHFSCPPVKGPEDLKAYNGYRYFGMGGALSLFLMPIYDEATARQFRLETTRAFELDKIFTEAADAMIEQLLLIERSFTEDVDYSAAVKEISSLLQNEGLPLF